MISVSVNPIQKGLGRNRHMPIRYFYFRQLYCLSGSIRLIKVSSENNIADLLVTYKSIGNFDKLVKMAKGYEPISM